MEGRKKTSSYFQVNPENTHCGGQNSRKSVRLHAQNLGICYITRQKRSKVTDGMKVVDQADYLGLTGRIPCHHRVLKCEKGKQRSHCHSDAMRERLDWPWLALKMEDVPTGQGMPEAA